MYVHNCIGCLKSAQYRVSSYSLSTGRTAYHGQFLNDLLNLAHLSPACIFPYTFIIADIIFYTHELTHFLNFLLKSSL